MASHAAFWDGIASKYAAQPVADPDAFERKIEFTRGLMAPSHRVLEIGCGTGSLAMRLADIGADYLAMDVSAAMVEFGREKAKAQGAEKVTFHVGPFDDTFDRVGECELDGVLAYTGLPCYMKPATGGGWKSVSKCSIRSPFSSNRLTWPPSSALERL